eukprot:COSAG02_NODE_4948_length_4798_cov_1.602894_4_plen_93_part_00
MFSLVVLSAVRDGDDCRHNRRRASDHCSSESSERPPINHQAKHSEPLHLLGSNQKTMTLLDHGSRDTVRTSPWPRFSQVRLLRRFVHRNLWS